MPRFIADDPSQQTEDRILFPDMGVYKAMLDDIKDRTHKRKDGQGDITFLDWYFSITGADDTGLIGRKVKGSTLAVLRTNGGELDRKFHNWASNILGQELAPGYPLDTDDLVGLEVQIVVELEPDYRDPSKKWPVVTAVANVDGDEASAWGGQQTPPF
jgi:hypothetical protein